MLAPDYSGPDGFDSFDIHARLVCVTSQIQTAGHKMAALTVTEVLFKRRFLINSRRNRVFKKESGLYVLFHSRQ